MRREDAPARVIMTTYNPISENLIATEPDAADPHVLFGGRGEALTRIVHQFLFGVLIFRQIVGCYWRSHDF